MGVGWSNSTTPLYCLEGMASPELPSSQEAASLRMRGLQKVADGPMNVICLMLRKVCTCVSVYVQCTSSDNDLWNRKLLPYLFMCLHFAHNGELCTFNLTLSPGSLLPLEMLLPLFVHLFLVGGGSLGRCYMRIHLISINFNIHS